jgi:opacity protein-like surface antigen
MPRIACHKEKLGGLAMRQKLLCGAAAIAIAVAVAGPASAADAPAARPITKAVAPPLMDWSGFYVGAHLGLAQARFSATPHSGQTDDGVARAKPSGLVGGVHFGQNWQQNTFVYGWELDATLTDLSKHVVFPGTANPFRHYSAEVNLLASLRGRLGMTLNPTTLLYLTGGLGYARAKAQGVSPFGTVTNAKHNKFGYVLGLGGEWKQTQNIIWRVEGLYYGFRSHEPLYGFTTLGSAPGTSKFKNVLVGRIGVSYLFSDRRLKRDISLLARLDNGLGLYRYRYVWSDEVYVGVMAQEVARIVPDAVACGPDGYLRVNYRRLGLRLMKWDEWQRCTGSTLALAA